MKIILCLGNVGDEYKLHRHNAGFMLGDVLCAEYGFQKVGKKFKSVLYEGMIGHTKVMVQCPTTFMNLSGEAIQPLAAFYKVPLDHILCVYDDFDIPFGSLRYREKGSAGTHNGLKSVLRLLASQDVPRLRVGIGPLPPHVSVTEFVLNNFSASERENLPAFWTRGVSYIEAWVRSGTKGVQDMASKLSNS